MRRFELFALTVLAAAAGVASAVAGWLELALASFDCFYTEPIGGAKCTQLPIDPFWIGFWDTLGFFSIPWTLVLIFFVIDHNRQAQ